MKKSVFAAEYLPAEALPFMRELLLEITRSFPSTLGRPPRLRTEQLHEVQGCLDAACALLEWFESIGDVLDERMEELETAFGSILQVVDKLGNKIHRAVHQTRRWVEDEMTFSQMILGVLDDLDGSVHRCAKERRPTESLRELVRRIEAKGRTDRDEAMSLSMQFDHAQRDLDQLRTQIAKVEERTQNLRRRSLRDALTGLWNRRAYNDRIMEEVIRAERYGCSLSIALCDVDHFKKINDAHGHRVGDTVLQSLAGRVLGMLRRCDILSRYGGEEFVIIFPNTELRQALVAAEKVRTAVNAEPMNTQAGPLCVAVSVGVAAYEPGDTHETLFERADQALYRAKESGRNRVEATYSTVNAIAGSP